jgi:hypothetical protein
MNKGDLTRIFNAFGVISETYPTHAPALISAFKDWLEEEAVRIDKQFSKRGADE